MRTKTNQKYNLLLSLKKTLKRKTFCLENRAGGLVFAFVFLGTLFLPWLSTVQNWKWDRGWGMVGRAEFGISVEAGGLPGAVFQIPHLHFSAQHVSEPAAPAGIDKFGQKHPSASVLEWEMLTCTGRAVQLEFPALFCFPLLPVEGFVFCSPHLGRAQCQEPSPDTHHYFIPV